jgi:hypothetical protein
LRVVREEQLHVALDHRVEEGVLLIDEQFGKTVVAHRDRQVHPRPPGDEIGAEHDATSVAGDFREHEPRRVSA